MQRIRTLLLPIILLIAALLRFSDLNWDQSQYNHPDERHVTNVVSGLRMPDSLAEYFDPAASPLNPYNLRQSWVYGTLPLFGARAAAEFLDAGCEPDRALIPALLGRALFPNAPTPCPAGFFTGYETIRLVGRMLSALADTLTVLAVFLTARRWFGHRAGLLAAAFSCLAVLQIQHAKFFVVEALLTACTAWSLYFCARISTHRMRHGSRPYGLWRDAALAGLFAGFAVACKISVWPTAALVVLSIVIVLLRDRRTGIGPVADALLATLIAGVVTFAGFRIAQPYGFVGASDVEWKYTLRACDALDGVQRDICQNTASMPDLVARLTENMPASLRPILAPSARWVAELQQAAYTASGQFDPPFGWQWANRAPITFPLGNIVFYGLGVPLALAALLGILFFARRALQGHRLHAVAVPLLWTVGFFLYQGTQYVKSIRYQLPIYPMLAVIAAAFLVAAGRAIALRLRGRRMRTLAATPAALVLGGTLLWTTAFLQIYRGELTRTEASRWVYENIPTAVTVSGKSGDAVRTIQLPISDVFLTPQGAAIFPIRLDEKNDDLRAPLAALTIRLNHLTGAGEVRARLSDAASGATIAEGIAPLGDFAAGADVIELPAAVLEPNRDYALEFTMLRGTSLQARTSVIANQHWDEGIPFRLDGKDGFGGWYRGLSHDGGEMPVYAEEDPFFDEQNPGKLRALLRGLDEADVLVLNSNRHYASVARLPWRFPMTNRYYEALMGGELGFELAADFYRFPQLGPFVFNDQEMPQLLVRSPNTQGTPPGIEVPYPKAEEAFSVYDHPRVLIFRKTPQYSPARAEAILDVFDPARTVKRTAFESSNTPGGLLLNARDRAAQQAGGTWSELFPRSSPLNQSPLVAVLAWLALLEAVGVGAFFLLAALLRPTPGRAWVVADGGFAVGKILALLLVGWTSWLLASVEIAPFERPVIAGVVAALLIAGAAVGHWNRDAILALLRARWRRLLVAELVFLAAFALWLFVRAGNPDLWHPYFGGEKPMDFAYWNSILKATWFPPPDPWFAGGYINYYYFGFVLIGWPVKLLGIDPSIAYNIAVPTLFALTALGAHGAAMWLFGNHRRAGVIAGLCAAMAVALLGNLQQLDVLIKALQQLGDGSLVTGLLQRIGGTPLPIGDYTLYWDATRPAPEVLIAEFPLFTFLYADLHAHMMAMPLALAAVALAAPLAAGILHDVRFVRRTLLLALGALVVGALWPANTWDYFPYLLLYLGAIVIGARRAETAIDAAADAEESALTRSARRWIDAALRALPMLLVVVVLSRAFFAPYYESFGSGYNKIEPWTNERTPLKTYLVIHGMFLLALAPGLLRDLRATPRAAAYAAGIGLAIGAFFVVRSASQSTAAWSSLLSAPIAALAFAAALRDGDAPGSRRLLRLMAAGAVTLTLFVEHFTLAGDLGRMNTQFKFYIAAWLLLGVAAAVDAIDLLFGARDADADLPATLRVGAAGMLAALVVIAALYPLTAIPGKMRDRWSSDAPRGLDGMAFMRYVTREEEHNGASIGYPLQADYDAIRWMQDNVQGSPTIMEGTAGGNQYRWAGRFSIYTGLPSVVGWQWHQRQQRGESLLDSNVIYDRFADVERFYSTQSALDAMKILRRYDVRYVVVSPYERIYNDTLGFDKFPYLAKTGALTLVYDAGGVRVYAVDSDSR